MARIQSRSEQLAFYNPRHPGDENVMVGADLGMLSSSAQYWPLLPHHGEMSEGPSPDRRAVRSKLRERAAICCQLSWIFKLCGKYLENIVRIKVCFWPFLMETPKKNWQLIEICRIGMILLYLFIRFLSGLLLREMSEVLPPMDCVNDGWTVGLLPTEYIWNSVV